MFAYKICFYVYIYHFKNFQTFFFTYTLVYEANFQILELMVKLNFDWNSFSNGVLTQWTSSVRPLNNDSPLT